MEKCKHLDEAPVPATKVRRLRAAPAPQHCIIVIKTIGILVIFDFAGLPV
jgi:hypothetical protein